MSKGNPPILVAAFVDEDHLRQAVALLQERKIGRDFIGILVGEIGWKMVYLVSVLTAPRLHEKVRGVFQECAAARVGTVDEMRPLCGQIPHPGAREDHDMKLPMGEEYPPLKRRQKSAGSSA